CHLNRLVVLVDEKILGAQSGDEPAADVRHRGGDVDQLDAALEAEPLIVATRPHRLLRLRRLLLLLLLLLLSLLTVNSEHESSNDQDENTKTRKHERPWFRARAAICIHGPNLFPDCGRADPHAARRGRRF